MSAMPPIATELVRPDELTRCATSGLMHRSKCGTFNPMSPHPSVEGFVSN
jgi:hypothetical protein